jgi:peptidyl-prolyl cis-trans isomerase B (cyclophilin B)
MSSLRRIAPILAVGAAGLALAACGGGGKSAEATSTSGTTTVAPPPPTTTESGDALVSPTERKPLDPNRTYKVVMKTSEGTFTITLDQKTSPHVAASVAALVRKNYYDGTTFHRIIPGFLIQGGDKTGTGHGFPGYTVVDKPPPSTKYTAGLVAMAKTGVQRPGTAGSQFFIVTQGDLGLPPIYAVLGRVTAGMPVVKKIGTFGNLSDPNEKPTKRVVVEDATLTPS